MSPGAGDEDRLMTVREAAEELRLTTATVRQWIRDGKLPAIRAGARKYVIRRSDLRRVMAFPGKTFASDADGPPSSGAATGADWDLRSYARPPR